MPQPRVNDTELLAALTRVFRVYGYEGASLSRISEETGLKRASLYHRFPGGKEQMVQAVLVRVDQLSEQLVLQPLSESNPPADCVRNMARRLGEFYHGGKASCVFETLTLDTGCPAVHEHIQQSSNAWIDAMARIARKAGLSKSAAKRRAEQAFVEIQGALVHARIMRETASFKRALKRLPALLTDPDFPA